MSYIARVELSVGFALRSLDICLEAVQSFDNSQIVAKFQLTTSIIARLAEACSSVSLFSALKPPKIQHRSQSQSHQPPQTIHLPL